MVRRGLGLFGFALLPACCIGLPLLVAAGVGGAALAWLFGVTAGAVALAVAAALFFRQRRTFAEAKRRW